MEFLLIAAAHFCALISPGPDFFLIMQASLRLPVRSCFALCAGIGMANGVYLVMAVLGIEAIREIPGLLLILKYLGAVYLIFLGIMLLRSPERSFAYGGPDTALNVEHRGRQFWIGMVSGLLNPKNAIFYLSLFTVMVAPETGLFIRLLYGLWMVAMVILWDCGLVLVIGRATIKKRMGRGVFLIEKISGIMLAIFGVLLPFG